MNATSETGHLKNITHFQDLISFCEGYGADYNPVNESLKIPQLLTLYQEALNSFDHAKTKKTLFDEATNERRNSFKDLKTLATQIVNAFEVSGVHVLSFANLKSVNNKIQGSSSKKKNSETQAASEGDQIETRTSISTSQQSYDRLIDHFANMILILQTHTEYNPNESNLKVVALNAKLSDMKAKNLELIQAYSFYSTSLIQRNKKLYDPLTGLVHKAQEVKKYVKSVFGAVSPQYRQISKLSFRLRK